ncbi:glycosyltransferase [Pantoea sp. Cy-639]|uniref:glycosyltransferase n=1 Tax=Pantoea sp. Cy-639 TaxID=2608360 RepID=UPI001420A1EF|nr:glycosyltransferase [Pantoea sp. Cy-639]NIF18832.1 glycosyltransferase family 4 protein [Pantoea sp. Cy-639]
MPQLLVIAHAWPEPEQHSAGRYMMQILDNFLGHGWQVTFASAATAGEYKADLAARGIREHTLGAQASLQGLPTPDVVLFDHFLVEERFCGLLAPATLRLLALPGLHSLREARQQLLRRRLVEGLDPNDFHALFGTSGPDLFRLMAPASLTQRELAAIWRCDLTLVASAMELDLLLNGFAVADYLLHHCPANITVSGQAHRPFDERRHFVSLGPFNDATQADAVLWMKHNLWPMLRRRLPEAQLHLYGVGASERTLALHAPEDGFHVRGVTEDPQAVLASARVCLAPLRGGAGFSASLAQALGSGTPSVVTPFAAQALQGHQPWPGTIAASAEGLAQAAAQLYADPGAWQQAQDACNALGQSLQRQAATLFDRLEHSLAHLDELRLFNFTGAMLRRQANA